MRKFRTKILILLFVLLAPVLPAQDLPSTNALAQGLANPGIALQTAASTAKALAELNYEDAGEYLPYVPRVLSLLELSQDYQTALILLGWLDQAIDSGLEVSAQIRLWRFKIPDYYLNLGDYSAARDWLRHKIPSLSQEHETYRAALSLAAVLRAEGRADQAQTLLEQRFLQFIRNGQATPFAAEGLLAYVSAALANANSGSAEEAYQLLGRYFPESLERSLAATQLGLGDQATPVYPLPTPSELLPWAEDLALGTLGLVLLEATNTPGEPELPVPETDASAKDHPLPAVSGSYLQIGSFSLSANAEGMASLARSKGFEVLLRQEEGRTRILVPAGPEGAEHTQLLLREEGIEGFIVRE